MSKDFPYTINIPKARGDRHWEQTQWCEQQFGQRWSVVDNREGTWCCFWGGRSIPGKYRFEFKNEQDAVLFSLTWL